MLKLFKTILKTGEATVKYPFAPMPVCKNFRGKPEHLATQCIACAACTIACPANALTMSNDVDAGTRTWELFLGRCIFCGRCEEVCPTKAIILSQDFELAVGNKADLYQQATFKLANCTVCEKPFAPQKEIEYTVDLLKQTGMNAEAVDSLHDLLQTCPECKRKQSVPTKANVAVTAFMTKGNV